MPENYYQLAYDLLLSHFGPQEWWPADSAFEVMVGAVLTQNTNWGNVSKAIDNLRDAGLLDYEVLRAVDEHVLAELIRPSGYYNLKARRLLNLLSMVENCYQGSLESLCSDQLQTARENLLSVKGVGPETADSILLYACGKASFVVDAYTHRVFNRHNLVAEETDYHSIQDIFHSHLPVDVSLYNEYHALIVRLAITYCKKTKPLCEKCPLQGLNW